MKRHSWTVAQAMEHIAKQVGSSEANSGDAACYTGLSSMILQLPEPLAEELRKFAHGVTGTKLKIGGRKVSTGTPPAAKWDNDFMVDEPEPEPEPEPERVNAQATPTTS